jgi:hypothetical protein
MLIFFIFVISFVGIVVILLFVAYFFSFYRLLRGDAPFVPVPSAVLPEITKALGIKENSVVYDLGCGDGKVLMACSKMQPKAKYVGYEISLAIYLLAWIRILKMKKNHSIKIFRKNFFVADFSKATHVFTYLMPKQMGKLEEKFEHEFSAGTRLVTCSFPLKTKEPSSIIDLGRSELMLVRKIYVYDF